MKISIDQIIITKDNPRQTFDEEKLRELGESIKTHGLLEPIIVRQRGSNYELIVGERRLRASALVGLDSIESNIKDVNDADAYELRLIENTHREDLSDAEKGDAILSLWANYDKYETIKAVCEALHLNYDTVKTLWITKAKKLSENVKSLVSEGVPESTFTDTHARLLLKYSHSVQDKLADISIKYKLTTRQLIDLTKQYDVDHSMDLDESAKKLVGYVSVEVPLTLLTEDQKKSLEEEKKQFVKIKQISKQRRDTISKPRLTKEAVKERFDKRADFKYEQVRVSHGSGNAPQLEREITPLIIPNESKPDYSLCQCALCTLFGSHCKGRCWNV